MYPFCLKISNYTACHSGAAKLARRQRGEKKCDPREHGRKLEHRWLFCSLFLFFFNTKLTSTERGASAGKFNALRATETGSNYIPSIMCFFHRLSTAVTHPSFFLPPITPPSKHVGLSEDWCITVLLLMSQHENTR